MGVRLLLVALALHSAAHVAVALQLGSSRLSPVRTLRGGSTSSSPSALFSAATSEQAKSGLGWDSHKAIDDIPASLCTAIEGNDSMRRKFEAICREAQASICKAVEELDGEGKFRSDAWVRESGELALLLLLQLLFVAPAQLLVASLNHSPTTTPPHTHTQAAAAFRAC